MRDAAYAGSCHCGAIGFRYATDISPARWSIRACRCRFCRMHDALSTSDPGGELQFHAADATCLSRYRFALRTADFLVCRTCGVYVGAVIEVGERRFGIINTRALATRPRACAETVPVSYDDEDSRARIGRRSERWTPVTVVPW